MDEIIFPPGTPEEFQEKVNELYQRQQMATEDFQHQVTGLFDGFTEEQLVTYKHMLHHIVMNTNSHGDTIAAYYEGIATGLLHVKFGICLGCDQNHEKLMQESGLRNTTEWTPDHDPIFDLEKFTADQERELDDEGPDVSAVAVASGWAGPLSAEQQKSMDEYGLDDLREEGTNVLLGFVCINCKRPYPSIEDRMLREPGVEGCGGCQQKAKWG